MIRRTEGLTPPRSPIPEAVCLRLRAPVVNGGPIRLTAVNGRQPEAIRCSLTTHYSPLTTPQSATPPTSSAE